MDQRYNKFYTYIKPVLKNKQVKDYAPLVFSLLTSALFIYFAMLPTLSTIISLQKALSEQKQILIDVDKKTESLTLARKNYQSIPAPALNNLQNLLPDYPAIPYLIDNINYLAQQNEATISGLQFQPIDVTNPPSKTVGIPRFEPIEFTATFQASYDDLVNILDQMNNANRLISIKTVVFNKPEKAPLGMSINGTAYYLKY